MQDEKQNISIKIDGLKYSLKVRRATDEEEMVRKAEKQINALILEYKKMGFNDPSKVLPMTLIQMTTEKVRLEEQKEMHQVIDNLKEINADIELFNNENTDVLTK